MKNHKKEILRLFFIVGILLWLGPWMLYGIGLWNVSERPSFAKAPLSAAEEKKLWAEFRETGPIMMESIGPWDYAIRFITGDTIKKIPGESVAWYVARNWNSIHLRNRRMLFWHLSSAAMTIWISRNWTIEEALANAKEISVQIKNPT